MNTTAVSRILIGPLYAICIPACGDDIGRAQAPGPPVDAGPDGRTVDASDPTAETDAGYDGGGACGDGEETLELVAAEESGIPVALYVPAEVDTRPALLHLDSASWATFVLLEGELRWVEGAATLRLGCEERLVPGMGGLGTMLDVAGLPVMGVAGADLLAATPTHLDVQARKLTRRPPIRPALDGGVAVTHELVAGVFLVEAEFDDVPVNLILDTGSVHSLWLGVDPEPGDVEIVTEDSLGDPLHVWLGSVALQLGTDTRTVPVLRAPTFRVLEEFAAWLGREVQGLVGLSSIASLFVDPASGTLEIGREW